MFKQKIYYGLVIIILLFACFVRVYRLNDLVGFYYDQGRDALVIWNLIHDHKFFLIGPTTGVEGIFLGPFYYYLITPFYWLGNGNPVWPATFLGLLNVAGIYIVFAIARKYFDNTSAILTAFIMSISYYLVIAHRWLSNPTPLPFFSALAVWSILQIINSKDQKYWPMLGLLMGLSLQLEAASATFFIPAVAIILAINHDRLRTKPIWILSGILVFISTLLPQLVFDFRHDHILYKSFYSFLIAEKSFRPELFAFLQQRLIVYQNIITNLFWATQKNSEIFIVLCVVSAVMVKKKLFSKEYLALSVWCLTPLAILLFYHGNKGYLWDYYFTGIFPFLILMITRIMVLMAQRYFVVKLVAPVMLIALSYLNFLPIYTALTKNIHAAGNISLGSSVLAVDWIYKDTKTRPFNVDVYVPPVISYAYDYLFLWRGTTKFHTLPSDQREPALYTLYEIDPPHPERLEAWLSRQAGIGKVETSFDIGGIIAERRIRI